MVPLDRDSYVALVLHRNCPVHRYHSLVTVVGVLALLGDVVAGRAGGYDHGHAVDHALVGVEVPAQLQAPAEAAGVDGDGVGVGGDSDGDFFLQPALLPAAAVSVLSVDYVHGVSIQ